MAVEYTKAEILQKVEHAANDMTVFYRQEFIKYRGKTSDTKEYYSEIIAAWCCAHRHYFDQIPQITRETTYKTLTHHGIYNPNSPRKEEITAMKMFNYCRDGGYYDCIGKVIDYQTPLKNKQTDEAGKIDLLAYDGKHLRLLELKKPDTPETMLRCVLEGFTYLKTVNRNKLIDNFSLPSDTIVEACPFVFVGSIPYNEMLDDRPQLKRLMKTLNSKPYYIDVNNDIFTVMEG